MATPKTPKTLKDLSLIDTVVNSGTVEAGKALQEMTLEQYQMLLDYITEISDTEKERLDTLTKLSQLAKHYRTDVQAGLKQEITQLKEKLAVEQASKKAQEQWVKTLKTEATKALDTVIAKNREIFETSHELQLQGNMTWKEYTALYNETYEVARKMNGELGKQLLSARELVKAQNVMVQNGWRGLDTAQLTNLSTQTALMQKTLGAFPQELQQAFQMSYRQFGNQTDTFVKSMGDNLNSFSNTFGITVSALTQTVSDMMASNTFLARNNMSAQLAANQSLMSALALSTEVGINSNSYITNLAKTAQFGTASQMGSLYQAGAYLQGFDVSKFQSQMTNQDYSSATTDLISSIYNTLSGMGDGYLRNEYMAQIGQGFGLSQDDLLQIMTNGANLEAYSAEVSEKILKSQNSMEDELKELHMTISQQFENLWTNSEFSQAVGSVMQELGLYGTNGLLKSINGMLMIQTLNTKVGDTGKTLLQGILGNKATASASATGLQSLPLGKIAKGLGGAALGVGSNILGYNMIANNTDNNLGTDLGGFLANVGGGAAGGALAGSAFGPYGTGIGALIGAGVGMINTVVAANDKSTKMQELEDKSRAERRAYLEQGNVVKTGDPVVDAINQQTRAIVSAVNGSAEASANLQFVLSMQDKTTTKGR